MDMKMASLYKPTYTKPDPKSGKRIKRKTRKWYGKFRDTDGIEHRIPLCTDKTAAQSMLNDEIRKAERRSSGLTDPHERHLNASILSHTSDYRRHLESKGDSPSYINQTVKDINRICKDCDFRKLADIQANNVSSWLHALTTKGRSPRTFNSYLTAVKGFSNWLVMDRRLPINPLTHLRRLKENVDLRHERRSLSAQEFAKLVQATHEGSVVECIDGAERAIIYIVACWTGLRRKELASLTYRSFDLDSDSPSVTVNAAYSKRRRKDTIPLHPTVVQLLASWLANKEPSNQDAPMFSLKTMNGNIRDTAKMMKVDLAAARKKWLEEAESSDVLTKREQSDFLAYCDSTGVFADFHANRHTFISNVVLSGASPKVAQVLARHSDINLTMQTYTHLADQEQVAAISGLPAPPAISHAAGSQEQPEVTTEDRLVPMLVPTSVVTSHESAAYGTTDLCGTESEETTEITKAPEIAAPDTESQSLAPIVESAPCRNRTYNLLIKSQTLCQLS
jgi:integrase